MDDLHVQYPTVERQGDLYVSVSSGQKPGWTSVRLCGPNGGGAATHAAIFYDALMMAACALADDRDGVSVGSRAGLPPMLSAT